MGRFTSRHDKGKTKGQSLFRHDFSGKRNGELPLATTATATRVPPAEVAETPAPNSARPAFETLTSCMSRYLSVLADGVVDATTNVDPPTRM